MAHPWFAPVGRSRGSGMPVFLLVLAWSLVGAALWAAMGLNEWLVNRRPAIVIEAFLVETATTAQVEELGQLAQEEPFFCELRYVDAEEARAEASRLERIRPLLDAYGGNPFLRSLRFTLCPDEIEAITEAGEWLMGHEGVSSVRIPEARVERLFIAERLLARVGFGVAALLALLGIVIAGVALRLRVFVMAPELEMYERLGGSASQVGGRVVWGVTSSSVVVAGFVAIGLKLASVLVRFSGGWVSWPGARLPDFPHLAGAGIIAVALVFGLIVALGACVTRSYSQGE